MLQLLSSLLALLVFLSGPATKGNAEIWHSTLAAKSATLELNTATTWGRAETLADHFARHGGDFAAKTADDYAGMASRFFQESQAAKLPTKIDSQGVIRVFDPKTGSFGSFNPNGTTRTFFKPSSPTYFDRQPGTLVP
jgi:pyocin large subunit-like protein